MAAEPTSTPHRSQRPPTRPRSGHDSDYDVAVIGGGPAGATAAQTLAQRGLAVLLLDREGRIKPCGGAVPPQLLREFSVPESLLEARITAARMVAPSNTAVDMEIGGFVGMVDRGTFDPWLRGRAAQAGAHRLVGRFDSLERDAAGHLTVSFREGGRDGQRREVRVRAVIGADGAASLTTKSSVHRRPARRRSIRNAAMSTTRASCLRIFTDGFFPTGTARALARVRR